MRAVFMGTPNFAVVSLNEIVASQHEVVAVVTVPDKSVGRGLKLKYSAVKQVALTLGIPVLQPADLMAAEFHSQLRSFQADVFVVVAFRILPKEVFEMPARKTVNLHSSLLPKYRGAAPINWAIINGETSTGVSTIFIERSVDAGDLLMQRETTIEDGETAGQLHDKLASLGAKLLVETLDEIAAGQIKASRQVGGPTKAPKITKEICRVDWGKTNSEVRNLIHGLSPVPGAYSHLGGKLFKFFKANLPDRVEGPFAPGEILVADRKSEVLLVGTGSGALEIMELQPEGKRRMASGDFLRGWQVKPGDCFESN